MVRHKFTLSTYEALQLSPEIALPTNRPSYVKIYAQTGRPFGPISSGRHHPAGMVKAQLHNKPKCRVCRPPSNFSLQIKHRLQYYASVEWLSAVAPGRFVLDEISEFVPTTLIRATANLTASVCYGYDGSVATSGRYRSARTGRPVGGQGWNPM